ncbi:hypothetical protein TcWFU_003448 [Taenia crassiceps]|uniref:Uncharacterized protein n=1 Tax=Taenia crassiceps TaxID=6207 RepID=A0ABR4QPX3_9CEST
MRSIFVEDNFLSIEHVQETLSGCRNKVVTTSWLCPSHWHATNLCAEVIHQRLWHLSELKKDAGTYKLDESPLEARICRAFELSKWLAKHYPSKPSRWTPTRLVGGGSVGVNDNEGVTEKTPRTRRRDARRAAHRIQKGSSLVQEEAVEACSDSAQWSASQIASQFLHITGAEAKQMSEMIDSWRIIDRQRLLDTSLSMSEMNALGGVVNTRRLSLPPSPPPSLPPPPRPPETYRQQLHTRAQTEEPRCETMESSKGSSVRFLGFWKRPEAKKKPQLQGEGRVEEELKDGEPKSQQLAAPVTIAEEERELLEVAAELKWLISESSRRLTDLCREEERLTGRLPTECIPECKAGHSAAPLTVITRSITCHSPANFPTNSSITPRSAISAAVGSRKFSDTTASMNESWSLRRVPPTATYRFDSTGGTSIPSTMSTSSTSGHRGQLSVPHHQISSHLIDQKSMVVSRVHPPLRVSASRGVYEMGNWLSESQTNYLQVQSRRGPTVLPEACRQSSEPPMVPKTADYSNGTYYNPYQRQRYHYYQQQQQQQEQRQHPHYYWQQDQQKHQRLRKHFHAYEMGDEEAVQRLQVELKARRTPQWSASASPQSLLQREKTPGPPQAAFSISSRNPIDHSHGARQSCPPCTHSRSACLDHEEEHMRARNYVSTKRTVVYHAGDRPAVY